MDLAEQVKRLAIIALVSDDELMDRIVLKGGNAIKLHEADYVRPSLDVDFSLEGDFGHAPDVLQARFAALLDDTFGREGLHVFDVTLQELPRTVTADLQPFGGGYVLEFKVMRAQDARTFDGRPDRKSATSLVLGPGQRRRYRVEFSKHEYCNGKVPAELEGFTVYVYTPMMIACEKVRAICQQMDEYVKLVKKHPAPRARDFFDIHHLVTNFGLDLGGEEAWATIRAMFETKRVPLSLLGRISDDRERHREDFEASVLATIQVIDERPLPFDEYVDFLIDKLRPLQARWMEDPPLG